MITINDKQRVLNLSHKAINLMLTAQEMAEYGSKLKGLNDIKELTKEWFRFEVVEKTDHPYEGLPKNLVDNMAYFNVLVRLVDSIHGTFTYAMENIDFGQDMETLLDCLKELVDSVCNANINQLDILLNRTTSTSVKAAMRYKANKVVKEVFEALLNGEYCNEEHVAEIIMTDNETSKQNIVGALDDNKPERIRVEIDNNARNKPQMPPESIEVTLSKIPVVDKRGNSRKKKGFDICIDGDHVYFYLGSTDQTFLYAAALLAKKDGVRFGTRFFSEAYANDKNVKWLRSKFVLFGFNSSFDEWYEKMTENGSRRINQASSQLRPKLWEALCKQNHRNAFYYLCVTTDNGLYKMMLDEDNIHNNIEANANVRAEAGSEHA